jgi:anthranilate phosphoribosyltransferase
MASAAMMDSVIKIKMPRVIETCGMGGDRGYGVGSSRKKGINASTLSSLVLAAVGLPSVKHGSYGNTSLVGSTEAIESFGAHTSMRSEEEVMKILNAAGYCFFDAHWCKTIHDLSHLLMMETVNHVIGPMTPPLSQSTEINKLMGVNEKVHPQTIVEAYALLHRLGVQNVGGVVVIAGLAEDGVGIDPVKDYAAVRQHTILDEFSPYASVVSVGFQSRHVGTFMVVPEDFGITVDPRRIEVENNRETVYRANMAALHGTDSALADYLAMNSALGLFAFEHAGKADAAVDGKLNAGYLKECFLRCREAIATGRAGNALANYVKASKADVLLAAV